MNISNDDYIAMIREALRRHNIVCPLPPRAVLLNPSNYELLNITVIDGLPILADTRVAPGELQIDCEGSSDNIEQELQDFISVSAEANRKPYRHVSITERED